MSNADPNVSFGCKKGPVEVLSTSFHFICRNLSNSSNEDYFPMNEAVLLLNEVPMRPCSVSGLF